VEQFGLLQFDVVTMWYVIEHFTNLDSVLRKVNSLVKNDGIFAFSTPCGEGISAKSNKDNFYQISPTDHYSIWEPSKAKSILKKYGFEVVKVVSTGHHPERFPCIKNSKKEVSKDSLKWKFVEKYSKLFNLGDTVEFYCVKKRNCNN
jgi:ubiquinone/menaquinone biosynthesis C-methylase UbiE